MKYDADILDDFAAQQRRPMHPDVTVETGSGDVELRISAKTEHARIRTGSGDVEIEAPRDWLLHANVSKNIGTGNLTGIQGDGSGTHSLTVSTGSGDAEFVPSDRGNSSDD